MQSTLAEWLHRGQHQASTVFCNLSTEEDLPLWFLSLKHQVWQQSTIIDCITKGLHSLLFKDLWVVKHLPLYRWTMETPFLPLQRHLTLGWEKCFSEKRDVRRPRLPLPKRPKLRAESSDQLSKNWKLRSKAATQLLLESNVERIWTAKDQLITKWLLLRNLVARTVPVLLNKLIIQTPRLSFIKL